MLITRRPDGDVPHDVELDDIVVPDLWHILQRLNVTDPQGADQVRETWHLAHDLVKALQKLQSGRKQR